MELRLQQLTEHVWLLPHAADEHAVQSCIGVIATQNESVLVDAGNSPRLTRTIKNELIRNKLPPVSRIIYTHHHWDHIYGACEFDVPVTAHVRCRAALAEEATKPWGIEYVREIIKREPKLTASYTARAAAIDDWGAFRIVIPDDVFETETVIQVDQLVIELQHVGGAHADDSIVVKVPQDNVMFLGDCYYPPPAHLRTPDSAPALDMLQRLQHAAYELYVEGHAEPFRRTELLTFLRENT